MSNPEQFENDNVTSFEAMLQDVGADSVVVESGRSVRNIPDREPVRVPWLRLGAGVVILGGIGIALFGGTAAIGASSAEIKPEVKVKEPAKAEVVKLVTDRELLPIPVAAGEVKFNKLKIDMADIFDANFLDIIKVKFQTGNIEDTFEGDAGLSFDILPGKATFRYNSDEDVLYIDAPKTGLILKVDSSLTQVDSSPEWSAWFKEYGATLIKGVQTQVDKAYPNGADDNDSIGREIIKKQISVEEGLREFGKDYMDDQIASQCGPLITQIPDFITQVKVNIGKAVQGELLDLNTTNGTNPNNPTSTTDLNDILLTMLSNPNIAKLSEADKLIHVKTVIKNVVVTIPQDENGYKLEADKEVAAKVKQNTEKDGFSGALVDKNGKPINIDCKIADNLTIISGSDTNTTTGGN